MNVCVDFISSREEIIPGYSYSEWDMLIQDAVRHVWGTGLRRWLVVV